MTSAGQQRHEDQLAAVALVTAAAGGSDSSAALVDLRAAMPQLQWISISHVQFDVDPDSERQDGRVLLGSGTYARVFAGRVRLGQDPAVPPLLCAVKRLRRSKGRRAERLLQEALTMKMCEDSNRPLLRALALGGDQYCLVLERMDMTLDEYVQECSPTPAAVIRLLLRCAELVQRAHRHSVCHYDIKAANFLINQDAEGDGIGRMRMEMCDFGFAVHADLQYLPDKVRGTPKFFAPELRKVAQKASSRDGGGRRRQSARGTEPPAKRPPADVFSFGALIQEVVFGEPYRGLSREEWMEVAASAPQRLVESVPAWPKAFDSELRQLMERCSSLCPADRPSINLICESLKVIATRAERLEARQPTGPAQLLRAPFSGSNRRRRTIVKEEDEQLSEELDGEGDGDEDADLGRGPVRFAARPRVRSTIRIPASATAAASGEGAGELDADVGAASEEFVGMQLAFQCTECSDSFTTENGLSRHSSSHRVKEGVVSVACSLCMGRFHSPRSLSAHFQRCSSQRSQRQARCNPAALLQHLAQHAPAAPSSRVAPLLPPMQPEDFSQPQLAANEDHEQRAAVAADGQRAATKLSEHFPPDADEWSLPLWMANFWRTLPPHIQRQFTLCARLSPSATNIQDRDAVRTSRPGLKRDEQSAATPLPPALTPPALTPPSSDSGNDSSGSSPSSSAATTSPPLLTGGHSAAAAMSNGPKESVAVATAAVAAAAAALPSARKRKREAGLESTDAAGAASDRVTAERPVADGYGTKPGLTHSPLRMQSASQSHPAAAAAAGNRPRLGGFAHAPASNASATATGANGAAPFLNL